MLTSLLFGLFYALAIYHRRSPAVHGRWMICTVFPLVGAVIDRIVGQHFMPGAGAWLPRSEERPHVPSVGFVLVDLTLVALAFWDWRTHRRFDVSPAALVLMIGYQIFTVRSYRWPAWKAFCEWFIGVPG